MNNYCKNCEFYRVHTDIDDKESNFGYCYFNPPVYVGDDDGGECFSHPRVFEDNFCSKFMNKIYD